MVLFTWKIRRGELGEDWVVLKPTVLSHYMDLIAIGSLLQRGVNLSVNLHSLAAKFGYNINRLVDVVAMSKKR
jgi:hypothetical protein